jgi:cysteine desulfurase / selenocysteine lyase
VTGAAPIDVDRVRAETPSTARRVHLNHAGASPSPAPVLDTVLDHLRREAEIGGYEAAVERAGDLRDVHGSIGRLLGCAPDQVALAGSATEAWESAFWALPWRAGDVVLTCRAEYVSNALTLLRARERFGIEIRVVPDDRHGQLDVDALERELEDRRVALVSVTHVPTHGGLVNPAAAIGERCRAAGVPFLLDACQSVGQLPTSVDELHCDLLSATGRKFLRAPRGTGFLYVRPTVMERLDPVFTDAATATWTAAESYELQPGAQRFELFERNTAAALGLGAAIEYALELGLDAIAQRVGTLAEGLRDRLDGIPGATVRDLGRRRCGIVTFTVDGATPDDVRAELRRHDVHVWVSDAAQARLDLDDRSITSMVRASVHYLTTEDELDRAVGIVADLAGRTH